MKELISALSKALNVAESELSSALLDGEKIKDGAGKFLDEKFAAHVAKINEEAETKRRTDVENTRGKYTKETAEKFEKAIADAVPGIDKNLKGDDLLKAIPEAIGKIKNITTEPEKIKASDTYMQGIREAEERVKKTYEDQLNAKQQEFETLKSTVEGEKVRAAVLAKAREFEDSLKLRNDIPAETIQALKAASQQMLLSGNKFKILENGEILAIDDKGEARKDAHGHTLKIESLITDAYKTLDGLKVAANPKGDGGAGEGGGAGAGGGSVTIQSLGLTAPKTVADFDQFLTTASGLKDQGKLTPAAYDSVLEEAKKSVQESIEAK